MVLSRRRLWMAGALVLVGWLGVCGVLGLSARADMERGVDRVEAIRDKVSGPDSLRGTALPMLREARAAFHQAHGTLRSPVLAPLRIVPVIGRQVRSLDALSGSAESVLEVGIEATGAAAPVLDRPRQAGMERVTVLEELAGIAGRASARMDKVDLGPSKGLIGPVDDAHDRLARELAAARRGARKLTVAGTGLASFLRGPRRYLVFAANNAEMRAGAGMPLSHGLMTVRDGAVEMGPMETIDTLPPPAPGLPLDPDMAAIWGQFKPNEAWFNVNMTPRFPASADLAARMWVSTGRPPVDGVLFLDVITLRSVLQVTGPVNVPGGSVDARRVVQEVLRDQYLRPVDRVRRRERLSEISAAAIAAMNRPVDVARLGQQMLEAVQGRHLLAWSSRPEEQRVWTEVGLDGDLASDSLMVSVLNRGGSKLDQFLKIDASLDRGTLTLRLHNQSKATEPAYVLGQFQQLGVPPGTYAGFLTVNLPGGTELTEAGGFTPAGRDGRTTAALLPLRMAPGEEKVVTLGFRLPADRKAVFVEPSARVPGIAWTSGSRRWTDSEGGRVVRF